MKQHERERFVSSIRSGVFFYGTRGIVLKVFSPTIDDEVQLSEVYHQAYSEAFEEGVMKARSNYKTIRLRSRSLLEIPVKVWLV